MKCRAAGAAQSEQSSRVEGHRLQSGIEPDERARVDAALQRLVRQLDDGRTAVAEPMEQPGQRRHAGFSVGPQ